MQMIDIVELRSYKNKITFSANLHVGQEVLFHY